MHMWQYVVHVLVTHVRARANWCDKDSQRWPRVKRSSPNNCTENLKHQEGLFEAKADGCLDSLECGTVEWWNSGMVDGVADLTGVGYTANDKMR